MAWLQAAGIGLGIADMFKDGPDTFTPWQQGHAAWQINNPNVSTPFGSVEYIQDDMGTPKHYRDDTYEVKRTLSPEMQQLSNRLMGMAGRGRETFASGGMGSKLASRMTQVLGQRQAPQYDRGAFGFGQTGAPTALPEPVEEEEGANIDEASYIELINALRATRPQYGV